MILVHNIGNEILFITYELMPYPRKFDYTPSEIYDRLDDDCMIISNRTIDIYECSIQSINYLENEPHEVKGSRMFHVRFHIVFQRCRAVFFRFCLE